MLSSGPSSYSNVCRGWLYCGPQPQLGWSFGRLSSGHSWYSNACACRGRRPTGSDRPRLIDCIVLYLYIYIYLLPVHTNQKRFQCERPREKRAVLRERKEALGTPVNKVDWLRSYLCDRRQTILFDGVFSTVRSLSFMASIIAIIMPHRILNLS